MVSTNTDIDKVLVAKVTAALKQGIDEATEHVVQQAVKDFEARLRKQIAIAAMGVESYYEVAMDHRGLVITVRKS